MRVLVVLLGDKKRETYRLSRNSLDAERHPHALGYHIIVLEADRFAEREGSERPWLSEAGWPIPKAGQIALVSLDGHQKRLGDEVFAVADPVTVEKVGVFLAKHDSPVADAEALLAEGLAAARSSGRKVWVQFGGPRCYPCTLLSRWLDDHRDLLGKDFIFVKLLQGRDRNVSAVERRLRRDSGSGIPWFAILESSGKVVVTSDGPLGNIGMPRSFEEVRHLRALLERTADHLTPEERAGLVKSLSPP